MEIPDFNKTFESFSEPLQFIQLDQFNGSYNDQLVKKYTSGYFYKASTDPFSLTVALENGKTYTWHMKNQSNWTWYAYYCPDGIRFDTRSFVNEQHEPPKDIKFTLTHDPLGFIVEPLNGYEGKVTISICRSVIVPNHDIIKTFNAVQELYKSSTGKESTDMTPSLHNIHEMVSQIQKTPPSTKKSSWLSSWFY